MNIISETEENYRSGWIKCFRSLESHWIWTNERYFKTWIWFLFRANHKNSKILFSGVLIDIDRGSFITSLKHISEAANLSIQETRHFISLLEKDKMIFRISNTQSTKITICNYESYQDMQQTINTPTTNEQQTNNKRTTTDKNVKNEKELKNKEYAENLNEFSSSFFESKYVNEKSLLMFDKLLNEYPVEKIKEAIENGKNDKFWKDQFLSPLKLQTKDKTNVLYIDKFLSLKSNDRTEKNNGNTEDFDNGFFNHLKK